MFKQRSKIILQDEAAAWIARLNSDQTTTEDQQQFTRWLETSVNHKLAFEQMSILWGNLDSLGSLASVQNILAEESISSTDQPPDQIKTTDFIAPKIWTRGLVAACFLLVSALIVLVPLSSPPPETILRQVESTIEVLKFSSRAGEQRTIHLADGSDIELNTNTALEVHFGAKKRKILLLKGEAYFNVAKDKIRPFIVDVGKGEVMAVGTAFNIYRDSDKTVVTVTEGSVEVTDTQYGTPVKRSSFMAPNQKITINEHGLGRVLASAKGENVEWRSNTVVFDDVPLPKALAEVGRYLPFEVVSKDASLSQMNVSGTFSLRSPHATLEAIVATFNLSPTQTDNGIEIRRVD